MHSVNYFAGLSGQGTSSVRKRDKVAPEATPQFSGQSKEVAVPADLSKVYFGASKTPLAGGMDQLREMLVGSVNKETYLKETEVIDFDQYYQKVAEDPRLIRTSAQRMYDMVMEQERRLVDIDGEQLYTYDFFRNPLVKADAISGMEKPIHKLVESLRGAAAQSGPEKRIILMVGPVGTAKTTIVNVIKRGLERYTKTDDGAMYGIRWDLTDVIDKPAFKDLDPNEPIIDSPMNEDPMLIVSNERDNPNKKSPREEILSALNTQHKANYEERYGRKAAYSLGLKGELSPTSKEILKRLLQHYQGDMNEVLKHVKAKRVTLSEADRTGITTFEPADEKGLRRAQLTGEVNIRKLMERGTDSDPFAFSYDGELPLANRGIAHFDELLKIPKSLLYPLLSASELKKFKADKFPLISYDGVLIGTTNIPDWTKTKNDQHLEAIRSRIIQIEVPYNSRIKDEVGIYEKDFIKTAEEQEIHVSPHTVWGASLWAIMTRIADPPVGLTRLQKALLYDGEEIKDYSKQKVTQMKKDVPDEAKELLKGISPRDIQDALSEALNHPSVIDTKTGTRTVDPFLVIDALRAQLGTGGVSNLNKEDRDSFDAYLEEVEMEVARRMIKDVKHALAGDEDDVKHLFDKYMKHLNAWYNKEKVRDGSTGRLRDPDTDFMEAIEDRMNWTDASREANRSKLLATAGTRAMDSKSFTYKDDLNLRRALEEFLIARFSDVKFPVIGQREHAKKDDQEKIDVVKARLIDDFGYNDHSAEIAMKLINDPKYKGSLG